MKYFRSYPWGAQLLLFMLLIATMLIFGGTMTYLLVPKFTGYNLDQLRMVTEQSPQSFIGVSLTVQGLLSVIMFLAPALLFAYLTHPKPGKYLGLTAPGDTIQVILVIFMMLGAMPVLWMLESLIGHIDFGAKVKADQAANDSLTGAYLTMPTFAAFIRAFVVMAVIPAFGEEMFFRGVLMRLAKRRTRTMALPVVFTAIVFAYSHTNIYGYLSIFLAGVLLAVIYNVTGSLWCAIVAHLFFNGFTVVMAYLGSSSPAIKAFVGGGEVPYYYVIIGVVVFTISFYLLLRNKTPLPANWTDDFPRGQTTD